MDRDTAVARIAAKIGFRTDLNTQITAALQDQQDEMERGATLPPFLIKEAQTFVITPSAPVSAAPQEYALPSNFIRESDEKDGNLRYQQTTPGPAIFLEKLDFRQAEDYFFGRRAVWWDHDIVVVQAEDTQFTPGTPKSYVLRKATVRIYPGPDVTYSLLWDYYGHDTALTGSNTTNQWLTFAPWLLIGKAGLLVATDLRDQEAIQYFSGLEASSTRDLFGLIYEREVAGRHHAMGSRL